MSKTFAAVTYALTVAFFAAFFISPITQTLGGALLGVESPGWSTLVQIVEASEADRAAVVERLAQQLVTHFGAPDLETARAAAQEEVAFAASLCNHPTDTLIAVHRAFQDGAVREAFRTLHPRGDKKPMRAFSFLEVEGEEEPGDEVNLVAMAESKEANRR